MKRLLVLFLAPILASAQPTPPPQPAPLPATPVPQPAAPTTAPVQPVPQATRPEMVNITLPRNPASEVIAFYESLTGKRIIRDSNLAGPELSIINSQPVPRQEAINLIESSLLLNGYTIVPVDENTVKILGPSRAPRTEGLPLYGP